MSMLNWISSWLSMIWIEIVTVYGLLFSRVKGNTHAERLESFYQHQAEGYDAFRKRFLHGREKLFIETLPTIAKKGDIWVDMGGGTGRSLLSALM